MDEFELVVVGAGLAGLTGGLIAAQHGMRTLIVDHMGTGGQVLNVEKIRNLPGFPEGIAGYELGPIVQEQCEAAGAGFAIDSAVGLSFEDGVTIVECAEASFRARSVILAMGSSLRTLGIPGEAEFEGRGVSHCASCDAPFFIGQTVAVAGGGDSAIEEAAVLADQVEKVLVFFPDDEPAAQAYLRADLISRANVELHHGTTLEAILGDGSLKGVRVRNTSSGDTREEPVSGVFIYAGLEPNTRFLDGAIKLDPNGHIVTDILMRTSQPGVFAAGDIRQHAASLVASAIGDGATAAVSAFRFVRGQ